MKIEVLSESGAEAGGGAGLFIVKRLPRAYNLSVFFINPSV